MLPRLCRPGGVVTLNAATASKVSPFNWKYMVDAHPGGQNAGSVFDASEAVRWSILVKAVDAGKSKRTKVNQEPLPPRRVNWTHPTSICTHVQMDNESDSV